jgi:lipase chaperone LimK
MRMWSRGRLLETRDVKKWPKEKQYAANAIEKLCVYSNFSSTDSGKSRILVCSLNRDHPEYEQNMQMIIQAQQSYNSSGFYKTMFDQQKAKLVIAERVLGIWRTMFMILALLTTFALIILA